MNQAIYLDYAAATPMDKRVCNAMKDSFDSHHFANASATHVLGKMASDLIESNRQHVANLIGADSSEIIWTSGATESNNLAIIGMALANRHLGNHIITSKMEHESVLKSCQYLETLGFKVTYLTPLPDGTINLEVLDETITNQTLLLSIMLVNNEIGIIQNIEEISLIARNKGVIFHVDAAQAAGKLPIDVKKTNIDLMSISAHKMYGPKGIGALYVNNHSNLDITPLLYGGLQERGLRPGTLPTHQIVGFGEACRIAKNEMIKDFEHATWLRDYFFKQMHGLVKANFYHEKTVPYIFNVHFFNLDEKTKRSLDTSEILMLSSRSSCSNHKKDKYSHVLEALGVSVDIMKKSYRISIGRCTTEEEILKVAIILKELLGRKTNDSIRKNKLNLFK